MTIDYQEVTFPWTLDEFDRRINYFAQNGGRFLTRRQRRRLVKKARKVGDRAALGNLRYVAVRGGLPASWYATERGKEKANMRARSVGQR